MKTIKVFSIVAVACLTLNSLAGADVVPADYIFSTDTSVQVGDYYSSVDVYDTPPDTTTVEMTGGEIGWLRAFNHSTINISGGRIQEDIVSLDHSTINIEGGEVSRGVFCLSTYSTINVSGGNIAGPLECSGGTVNVSGGRVSLLASVDGTVNINGGELEQLEIAGAEIHISGGQITDCVWGDASHFPGTASIYGYDFHYEHSGGKYQAGRLTGFWQDSTPFGIDFFGEDAWPCFVLIPEPATALLFGLGGLALLRKRKNS